MSYELKPFESDGCSMWPDGNYRQCCVEHDRAYHAGGTKEQRRAADEVLRDCVEGNVFEWLKSRRYSYATSCWLAARYADLVFLGVRLGGGPWMPAWGPAKRFRWGYGRVRKTGYDPS